MAVSIFGATKVSAPARNVFDLSHSVKTTTNAGYLKPVACIPVVPGDSFDIQAEVFTRLAPLATPVMANMDVKLEAFYVANRHVWNNWEKFIVFEHRPSDDPKPVMPYIDLAHFIDETNYNYIGVNSLADHLGVPVTMLKKGTTQDMKVSALPFAAYQKIWLDYYCDRNLQEDYIKEYYCPNNGEEMKLFDGDNSEKFSTLLTLHRRMWRKDYFTSALPTAQRGADVNIPVTGGEVSIQFAPGQNLGFVPDTVVLSDGEYAPDDNLRVVGGVGSLGTGTSSSHEVASVDNSANLKGTVETLNGTITDLRTAMATQRLLELSMRVGSRLKEQLLGIFGVKSSDQRLDRAEFLGSSSVPIMISEVAQTSETTSQSPQGNLTGRGVGAGFCNFKRSYFEEHGYVMIIMSVLPRAAYFQGMPRHFKNFDFTDFYWPMFQHIGEQAIRKEEIYFGSDGSENLETFGYAPRYSDYKWLPSSVHGEFREGTLQNMHMARVFANRPLLNQSFLDVKAEVANRVFAVTADDFDHFWMDIYFKIKAKRPMDYFGSPR